MTSVIQKVLTTIGLLLCVPLVAVGADTWQAGVARVNISPKLPIWLSGYASRTRPATSKHDDLWAKALVLQDANGRQVVLVTMDLVGIDRELSQTVCRRIMEAHKLSRSAIALCTSHTHSGPVIRGNLAPMFDLDADQTSRVKEYKRQLADSLVDVVARAFDSRAPAKVESTVGTATFAVNRRNNPEGSVDKLRADGKLLGPVDHDVPMLVVKRGENEIEAIVVGYACHATVLSDYFISADWPGAAQQEIERRHPGATALYFLGCGGDQNPLPRRNITYVQKYGEELADAVDGALKQQLQPVEPALATAYEEIDLPFDQLPTRGELERTAAAGERPQGPWAKYLLSEMDRVGKLPQTYPYPVQAWRVGQNLTWLFLGGEVVVDYSLRLKAELGRDRTWVASYSNDVMGYIPSRRVRAEGRYEGELARFPYGLPAPWDPKLEEMIVLKVHGLAAEVSSKGK